jgi:LPXTG-motif cell wall-anchored protein
MWTSNSRIAAVAGLVIASVVLAAGPASAASKLTLSKSTGLVDGDRITVNGSSFTPNLTQIAIGQCIAAVQGPSDCNLAGGATFVNADASGNIPPVSLKLSIKFGAFDCTKVACVIAAQILPSSATPDVVAANKATVSITFGGSAATTTGTAPTTAASLPKTGPGDEYVVLILAGSALLLPGIGFLLLLPHRRRSHPLSS